MTTKLRSAGLAIETLPGPPLLPPGLTPLELSQRGRALAKAGVIGVREGPSRRDPRHARAAVRHDPPPGQPRARAAAARRPSSGSSPTPTSPTWHLTVDNGSSTVAEGEAPSPDLRLRALLPGLGRHRRRAAGPAARARHRPAAPARQPARARAPEQGLPPRLSARAASRRELARRAAPPAAGAPARRVRWLRRRDCGSGAARSPLRLGASPRAERQARAARGAAGAGCALLGPELAFARRGGRLRRSRFRARVAPGEPQRPGGGEGRDGYAPSQLGGWRSGPRRGARAARSMPARAAAPWPAPSDATHPAPMPTASRQPTASFAPSGPPASDPAAACAAGRRRHAPRTRARPGAARPPAAESRAALAPRPRAERTGAERRGRARRAAPGRAARARRRGTRGIRGGEQREPVALAAGLEDPVGERAHQRALLLAPRARTDRLARARRPWRRHPGRPAPLPSISLRMRDSLMPIRAAAWARERPWR